MMSDAPLDLTVPFGRHDALIRVRPDSDGGWAVSTEVDGREIAADYCPDWRRIERFRTRMQQWLKCAEAEEMRNSAAN
ncbi:MAG: hypothetical protein H0T71_06775 [Acidobacteria bacterium]|nr:hypothetical protein [Acidobacteriota bacterium]